MKGLARSGNVFFSVALFVLLKIFIFNFSNVFMIVLSGGDMTVAFFSGRFYILTRGEGIKGNYL